MYIELFPCNSSFLSPAEYLSYSKPNSSWPILGASGSYSMTDESEATESHDMARLKTPPLGGFSPDAKASTSETKNDRLDKIMDHVYL